VYVQANYKQSKTTQFCFEDGSLPKIAVRSEEEAIEILKAGRNQEFEGKQSQVFGWIEQSNRPISDL
jgi:hypothetical protein